MCQTTYTSKWLFKNGLYKWWATMDIVGCSLFGSRYLRSALNVQFHAPPHVLRSAFALSDPPRPLWHNYLSCHPFSSGGKPKEKMGSDPSDRNQFTNRNGHFTPEENKNWYVTLPWKLRAEPARSYIVLNQWQLMIEPANMYMVVLVCHGLRWLRIKNRLIHGYTWYMATDTFRTTIV